MTTKAKIYAAISAAALILAVRLIFFSHSGIAVFNPVTAEAGQAITYTYDSGAAFYSFNSNGFFFCTKDRVKYLTSKYEQQWDAPISLAAPVLYGKCDILAAGEPKGRKVYVFNTLGKILECGFDSPILSFSVNRVGDLTVILQTQSGYRIETYTPGSAEPIWKYIVDKPNIYPISADTSPDGTVTAVSMLDLNPDARHSMTTQIMFMYTDMSSAMAAGSADGIFAGETLPDQIARIYFMDRKLLAVSDSTIAAYNLSDKAKIKKDWEIKLTNKISQFCTYGEAGFAFIAGDAFPDVKKSLDAGTLCLYNMNGRNTGRYAFDSKAGYLSMNLGYAIAGSGRDFCAVNSRGALIWQYKSPMDLKQLIFLDNENLALSAGATAAAVIRRGV